MIFLAPSDKAALLYETAMPGAVFFDLNYDPVITPFMHKGLMHSGVAAGGLRMLPKR